MSKQPARLRILITNAIAAILAILVFGLTTSYAKPSEPTPFLSPTGGGLTPRAWLPIVMKNYPFFYSTSYYVKIADYNTLYNLGCSQGSVTADGQDIVVVLDFGEPWYSSGTYGALIFDANLTFKSISQITDSAKGFLSGFYHCSPLYAYLKLAVGVNNEGPYVNNAHGRAWAQMINDLNAWISANFYGSQESARGGMDIEQSAPYFDTAAVTRDWVDGYTAVFTSPSYYVDFGSCDGCPLTPDPAHDLPQDWTVEDVWYVSYGAGAANPLPLIYATDGANAVQWYQMSLYSFTTHNYRMGIRGTMTQYRACLQRPCNDNVRNSPGAGYSQLYDALNANPQTAQSLDWATDINWQGESP